jgi:3-oxoacyl-[acyl-carrier-protein] synthase III
MAYLSIPYVKISGISACVPKQIDQNLNSPVFSPDNGSSFIKTTGIERRRKADSNTCASDL